MKEFESLKFFIICLLIQMVFISNLFAQMEEERAFGNKSVGEKRIALVIGNTDYEASIGKLKNPANDANDMAEALKRLGFSLVGGKAQLNLNRRRRLEQINEFGEQIRQGGVGVFYFAGHGVQVERRNYLIPITDSLRYQEDAKFEAVDVDAVLSEMEYANNTLNILILDACRNNPLPKKTRNTGNGLIEPNRKPSGVYIAFAARDGQTASENSTGRNGLYTQELLKNLEAPDLRLEDIFINTRREVKRLSNRTQEPIEYGSLDAAFYFKLSESVSVQPQINLQSKLSSKPDREVQQNINSNNSSTPFTKTPKFKTLARNLLKYDFDESEFREGLLGARNFNTYEYGFINESGETVIKPKYSMASPFSKGFAVVGLSWTKWMVIDKTGKVFTILNANKNTVGWLSDGLIALNAPKDGTYKWGFMNKNGKVIIGHNFEDVERFSEDLACVSLDGKKYGFINKSGQEVIPFIYDNRSLFSEGLAGVKLNGCYGFIDKAGNKLIDFRYDDVGIFSEGLAKVNVGNKWGFINKAGTEIIPFKYTWVDKFSDGLAEVRLDLKYGFIDKEGKEVIPIKYDGVWCKAFIKEGFVGITLNDKRGFVDIYGNEYFDF